MTRVRTVIAVILAIAGLLLIMAAGGSVDYAFEAGKEAPSMALTLAYGFFGIACFVGANLVWGGER